MSEIFSETNMERILGEYIPAGEMLSAGIHAIAKETDIKGVFGKCVRTESQLIPDENGGIVVLNKKKYGAYDIYLGITQSSLVIAGCERESYLYQFEDEPNGNRADIQDITAPVFLADIGTCYPLADIRKCEMKKGMMGSVNCFITMKNGSYFKIMIPKRGGLGGGMPHYAEYREAIMERLGACNVQEV